MRPYLAATNIQSAPPPFSIPPEDFLSRYGSTQLRRRHTPHPGPWTAAPWTRTSYLSSHVPSGPTSQGARGLSHPGPDPDVTPSPPQPSTHPCALRAAPAAPENLQRVPAPAHGHGRGRGSCLFASPSPSVLPRGPFAAAPRAHRLLTCGALAQQIPFSLRRGPRGRTAGKPPTPPPQNATPGRGNPILIYRLARRPRRAPPRRQPAVPIVWPARPPRRRRG